MPGALTCLNQAHALFRGIKRPLAEDDEGADVLAYVLKPALFFEYSPDMVSVALKVPVPEGNVFVAYARLQGLDGGPDEARGRITHWGFVEADKSDPDLPVDYASRYRTRLW